MCGLNSCGHVDDRILGQQRRLNCSLGQRRSRTRYMRISDLQRDTSVPLVRRRGRDQAQDLFDRLVRGAGPEFAVPVLTPAERSRAEARVAERRICAACE